MSKARHHTRKANNEQEYVYKSFICQRVTVWRQKWYQEDMYTSFIEKKVKKRKKNCDVEQRTRKKNCWLKNARLSISGLKKIPLSSPLFAVYTIRPRTTIFNEKKIHTQKRRDKNCTKEWKRKDDREDRKENKKQSFRSFPFFSQFFFITNTHTIRQARKKWEKILHREMQQNITHSIFHLET